MSFPSLTSKTCQLQASLRFFTFSLNDIDKGPSKVTLFASYKTINLPNDK